MYLLNVQSVPEKMIFNLKINRKCKMKFFNNIRLHFRENEFENLYLSFNLIGYYYPMNFQTLFFRVENMKKIYSIFSIHF